MKYFTLDKVLLLVTMVALLYVHVTYSIEHCSHAVLVVGTALFPIGVFHGIVILLGSGL